MRHLDQPLARAEGPRRAAGSGPCRSTASPARSRWPSSPRIAECGTRTSSKTSDGRAPLAHGVDRRATSSPRSRSTRKQVTPPSAPFSLSVTAKTMTKSASLPPVMNVFSPLITHSSPSRRRDGADVARVRAGTGLGDREARLSRSPLDRRAQVALLLLLVGVEEDVVGVAAEAERHERRGRARSRSAPPSPRRAPSRRTPRASGCRRSRTACALSCRRSQLLERSGRARRGARARAPAARAA